MRMSITLCIRFWLATAVAGIFVGGLSARSAQADCADYSNYIHQRGSVSIDARDLKVAGGYAFVAGDYGLHVVNISDPDAPALGDSVHSAGSVYRMTLAGNLAYLAEGNYGLQIVDVSNPTSPAIVGTVQSDTLGYVSGVAVVGGLAYLAAGIHGLRILDVSAPGSATIVGSADLPGFARDVLVAGTHAFVAAGTSLQVVDISDPASPGIVGEVPIPLPGILAMSGHLVFVGNIVGIGGTGTGLYVVDVADPTAPDVVATIPIATYGVAVSGTLLYLANGAHIGFRVFDAADPASPEPLAGLGLPGATERVDVAGDFAYVTTYNRFTVVDISNPHAVEPTARLNLIGARGSGVAVAGYLACVAADSALSLVDVADPASPSVLGSLPGAATDVAMAGSLAYVMSPASLRVVDISAPDSPSVVGTVGIMNSPQGFDVSGHLVGVSGFIAGLTSTGLQLIDVTDPAAPALLSTTNTPSYAYDVALAGHYAYIADYNAGLQILDISDPAAPVTVGAAAMTTALRVAVAGNYCYVGGGNYLAVVDITNPALPLVVGLAGLPPEVHSMSLDHGLVYVADYTSGMYILDVTDPVAPRITGSALISTSFSYSAIEGVAVAGASAYATGIGIFGDGSDFWVAPTQCLPVVPVALVSFGAEAGPEGIEVSWTPASEDGAVGYYVDRSDAPAGPYVRRTATLLTSSRSYRFLDTEVTGGNVYFYRLEAVERTGRSTFFGPVSARMGDIGARSRLGMSHPNPLRGTSATIDFELSTTERAQVQVFDVTGHRVRELLDEVMEQGRHTVSWDGRNDRGEPVATGMYFYRLDAGTYSGTHSVALIR